jgi:DNA-binding NtrC family response regulator
LKIYAFIAGTKLANNYVMMEMMKKKILIVDEAGFSRICSAILEKEGYGTNAICDVHKIDSTMNYSDFGLVITSYPFGAFLLEKLKHAKIPTIILSDHMNRELMMTLEHFDKSLSYCMIKPLDYNKFRTLVNQTMRGDGEITA